MTTIKTFDVIYIHHWETKDGHIPTLAERAVMRKTCGPYQWCPTSTSEGRGFYQSSRGLFTGDATFRLRLELANDHLTGRMAGTTAYWADTHGDQTVTPIIARLPHGRGFLAGYTYGRGMCAGIDRDIYPDAVSAALAAHNVADHQARADRDYQANECPECFEPRTGGVCAACNQPADSLL